MKIAVGMSGGVDSSVAAYLLKSQGHDVCGVTLRLWHEQDDRRRSGGCCSIEEIADARRVCNSLNIPHYVLDLEKDFRSCVVDDFIDEYTHARTPNPCIVCNEKIKFGIFLDKLLGMGFDAMATGHYARIEKDSEGIYHLLKGLDPAKDQTYVLYRLTQRELSRLLLPLGDYEKKKVRDIAAGQNLPVAHKPDSQEICFIDEDYVSFLRREVPDYDKKFPPGPIITTEGKMLGKHRGLPYYTLGQKSGLGLTYHKSLYITEINPQSNTLVVGDRAHVQRQECSVDNETWVAGKTPSLPFRCDVKIRRQHTPAPAIISRAGAVLSILFDTPQFAITPGQAAVFYKDDETLGGGIIHFV